MALDSENRRDPWGAPRPEKSRSRQGQDTPPDLEEVLSQARSKFQKILGGGKSSRNGDPGQQSPFSLGGKTLSWILLIVLAAIWFGSSFYVINEQERGVVLRLGRYHDTIQPGLRWQPYWIDKVHVVNVTRVRTSDTRVQMLTEDENIVDVALQVQYIVQNPQDFYLNVRNPDSSLSEATDSALRHVVGGTIMDQVITEGRAVVAQEVQTRLQGYLDKYGTGILVRQVNIQRADPPQEVKPAFEDVISAREDEVRFVNQATAYANGVVPEARGQALRILEEANGYKSQVIARAEGEAVRFEKLLAEYQQAPEVTRQRLYIEAMEEVLANSSKVLVDVEGGNNILYLPLDRILGSTSNSFSAGQLAEEPSSTTVRNLTDRVLDELNRRNNPRSSNSSRR